MSIVEKPAIEVNFIALAKEEPELRLSIDKKQHKIYGPVLIPNKKVYRTAQSLELNEDGYIYFEADTIKKLSELYMENELINHITLNHETSTEDIKCIESWIIMDSEKDKANALGFKLPVGTWMLGHKINNMNIWKDIEEGKLNGYSIEASGMDLEEVVFEDVKPARIDKLGEEELDLTEDEMAKLIVLKMIDTNLIVEPNEGESEEDFIGRCVKIEIDNGHDQKQSLAICYSKWENK